jgi:hypothetical protein
LKLIEHIETLLRLTASKGTSWIDAQQDATPKGKNSDIKVEHTLRVFENWVLRRISGPKRDEVTGGRRKLHNESFVICSLHQL